MTDHTPHGELPLDRLLEEIRAERLDERAVASATERVWRRIDRSLDGGEAPLRDCADVRPLLGDLAAGRLSPGRAVLVADHARSCPGCRRALAAARSGLTVVPAADGEGTVSRTTSPLRRSLWLAAAAVLVIGFGLLASRQVADYRADRRLQASVAAVNGGLRLVSDRSSSPLQAGATIRAAQRVRTAKQSGAVLRLADGSTIEMAARSELELRGSRRGTTVALARGNIIVHAAKQHGGRLMVRTADCRVAVKGTIFAVDSGLKGSRVSVIQGEVEVRDAAGRELLSPGQQVTTSDRLETVPIADQIAWSRDAETHLELLRQLGSLQRDMLAAMEPRHPRTSTELLDLAPPDTVAYVALPNLAEGLDEARLLLQQRLAEQPVLAEWWQREVVASGLSSELDQLLDRLQPLAASLGEEVVIALPAAALERGGSPLIMARLQDPPAFVRHLRAEVKRLNAEAGKKVVALMDDPAAVPESGAEAVLRVDGDLFAAATDPSLLTRLASRQRDPSGASFVGTNLHRRLEQRYREGVSWLVGVDVGKIIQAAARGDGAHETELLGSLGLLDARTLIVERHRVGEHSSTTAELLFAGPRRGMASWLAAPAPMGSLSFISPRATLTAAVVAKEPRAMFDELVSALTQADPAVPDELETAQRELGFDLRSDLAATLGGEAAFALDGPLLPTPAWKIVVEVYDPGTFQATVERAVDEVNRRFQADGRPRLSLTASSEGGRTYHTLRDPRSGFGVTWVMTDGYLLAAPRRAVLDQALAERAAGVTLTASDTFRELLPDNGYADCSAMVYRNLSDLADQVKPGLPSTAAALSEPGLLCVYGQADRILVSATGGSLLGGIADLGLLAAPPLAAGGARPVSSPG